jgi:hypothetical protein
VRLAQPQGGSNEGTGTPRGVRPRCEFPDPACRRPASWRVAVGTRTSDAQLSCGQHLNGTCRAMLEAEYPRAAVTLVIMAAGQEGP